MKWINVNEELPVCELDAPKYDAYYSDWLLVYSNNAGWQKGYYSYREKAKEGIWYDESHHRIMNITYFAYIEPPKEQE